MKKKQIYIVISLITAAIAFSPVNPTYASKEDVATVIAAIDSLPNQDELNASHANMVKSVWNAYSNLVTAEKIEVTNLEKLTAEYDKLVATGIIKDEEKEAEANQQSLTQQRASAKLSKAEESQATDYTFDYSKDDPISVVVRYTTDADGDGKGDVPGRITLTSPTAETYPVVSGNSKLTDENLNVGLSWEINFVQMDFANAMKGKWTISTSIPCTFNAIDYAGAKKEINHEDETDEKGKEKVRSESTRTQEIKESETPKKKSGGIFSKIIFPIIALLVAIGGLRLLVVKLRKLWGKESAPSNKGREPMEDEFEEPSPLTEDEIIKEMRYRYKEEREIEESIIQEDDEPDFSDLQEGAETQFEDDENIAEYKEGETGLLSGGGSQAENSPKRKNFFEDDDDDDF